MTSQDIRNTIAANERRINQYWNEKNSLENQIDDLERLRDKFSKLQSAFENRQSSRRNKIARFSSTPIKNKIFKNYYAGIYDLLNGKSFMNAYDGLSEAKNSIWKQIQHLLKRIEQYNSDINYLNERNAYWNEELRKALERESAMEGNG